MRYILRNAYDGHYEQAIKLLVAKIEEQEKTIKALDERLKKLEGAKN